MARRPGERLSMITQDYEQYIARYMHENHMSFATYDETEENWRENRAYEKRIADNLIEQSKTFLGLLDKELNLGFRKNVAKYIAEYLSVYFAKNPDYENNKNSAEEKAKSKLNNIFVDYVKAQENAKKAIKANKRPKDLESVEVHVVSTSCRYNLHTGCIETTTKTITYRNRRYPYDDVTRKIEAAQRKHNACLAAVYVKKY